MSDDASDAAVTATPRPVLRVVNGGQPSDEELAAVIAVLTARAAASGGEEHEQSLRPELSAWVKSGLIKGTRTKA